MEKDMTTLEFTPDAEQTVAAMWDKVCTIGGYYGEMSPEYRAAVRSFAASMKSIVGLGGKVMKDGEYSLICHNEYITYGVNWSPSTSEEIPFSGNPGTWSVNS
jgi:hypothetical protein